MDKRRIWELDALRGMAVLAMVGLHLLYDLQAWYGIPVTKHKAVAFAMEHGAKVFILLSGLCAQLGSRSFRRGCIVLGAGAVVALVTGITGGDTVIRFGILHLLGTAMILWPLFRPLPWWALIGFGSLFILAGMYLGRITVSISWLYPIGLCRRDFFSADYFPICPYFGWFLLGGALGKTLYRSGQTRLPRFPADAAPVRFFRFCGRHSLWIYLLHQPVLLALLTAVL